MKIIHYSILATPVLAGGLLLAACGSGGGSVATGTVSASLTDSPSCGYDHVYVTVSQVSVNGGGTWYDINLPAPRKIDLLSLTNGALESLGQTALPAGTYQQVRLMLVPNPNGGSGTLNNSVVPSGQSAEVALDTPSAVQTGIKINTRNPFTVQAGTLVDVVLDFNACQSVVTKGKGGGNGPSGYLLKPVVTATPAVVSGSIDGYTMPGATVYAEQAGSIVRGTVADNNGYFKLSPLEQSTAAGNYDVVLGGTVPSTTNSAAVTYNSSILAGVPVTAQANTSLSSGTAPIALTTATTGTVSGTVTYASSTSSPVALYAQQTVSGNPYVISQTNADSTTGSFSFTLPTSAPSYGVYSASGTLLSPFSAAAGSYTIHAVNSTGGTADQPVTVSTGANSSASFNL